MSESSLSLTYNDIAGMVGVVFSYGPTVSSFTAAQAEQVAVAIRRGLRQFYFPPPLPKEPIAHKWSFLHPHGIFATTAPYTTGTVTVVNGYVTGSATVDWPTWAVDGEFVVGGATYTVAERVNGAQLLLEDETVDAAAASTYSLNHVYYTLPDNFGGFDRPPRYIESSSPSMGLETIPFEQMMDLKGSGGARTGRPCYGAVRTVSATTTAGQRYKFAMWPTPDAAYALNYTAHILPDMISTTEYPLGGAMHAETILASCLHTAAEMLADQEHIKRRQADFLGRLSASIAHDRQRMVPDRILTTRELSETFDPQAIRGHRALSASYGA